MKKNSKKLVVSLKNICKDYEIAGGQIQRVLHNISFDIYEGEFVSIMGQSGSGKSTTMNIIGALDEASSGEYYLYGNSIKGLSADELATARNEYIGFVFQNFNLLSKRTIIENVMLPLMYRGISKSERHERAIKMIEAVKLKGYENYYPNQLSGGMKQRVAIARALAGDPKLILADEPTGNLDSKTGDEILKMFKQLNQDLGITIIMITHEFEIAQYSNRLIYIHDGKIEHDGKVKEIR